MAYISPTTHPSSVVIDEYAARAGRKRKLVQRDRMAFGDDEEEWMTQEEMVILMRGCLAELVKVEHRYREGGFCPGAVEKVDAEWWTKCWVVLLFITLVAPRSQTLASLTTSSVLAPGAAGNASSTQYLVRVSAELNKAEQAFICHVPEELTPHMAFYLRRVLPQGHEGALFRTRSGKTRTDFGEMTRPVCTKFVGRPINPHKFRTSVATAMYERPDVDEGMMRGLADHMTHGSAEDVLCEAEEAEDRGCAAEDSDGGVGRRCERWSCGCAGREVGGGRRGE